MRLSPSSARGVGTLSSPRRATVIRLVAVASAYAVALGIGLVIRAGYPANDSPIVWAPLGVVLGATLLLPRRERPYVLPAVFVVATVLFTIAVSSVLVATLYGASAALSLWLATWVLTSVCGERIDFGQPREAFTLVAVAVGVAVVGAAPLAVLASTQNGVDAGRAYLAWAVATVVGMLVFTPAIVTVFRPVRGFWQRPAADVAEVAVYAVAGTVMLAFLFGPAFLHPGVMARAYMFFPFIIWAALRFGPTGTSLATTAAFLITIALTLSGASDYPLGGDTPRMQAMYIGGFYTVAAATGLILAASVATHRRSEDALRASDARYRAVTDHASEWVAWASAGLAWRYISPACEAITGYQAAEFLADESLNWKIAHPDDRDAVRAHFEPTPPEDSPAAGLAYRIIRRDGEIRWLRHDCRPVRDADGSLIGRRTTNRDITDEKRLADELRASEALLRLVIDAVPANIAYLDADLRYRAVNRAYAAFIDREPADLSGTAARDALGEAAWATVGPNLERALAGEPFVSEFAFPTPGAGPRWVRASYTPDVDGGRIVGVVVMVLDLTDRRAMEAALAEREERYRVLTETMRDVIWVLDVESSRFTYVSPSVERLRGYTAEEVMAEPMDAALPPEAAAMVRAGNMARADELRRGIITEDTFFTEEVPQPRRDGSLIWTDVTASYHIDPATDRVVVHGLTRDISERRRAQEALVRASRMEAVGQLAGGVAHDFNNLLTAIRGFADLLRGDLPADDPHVADVDEIIRAADRAADLTRSLLAYSRRQVLLPQLVRPAEIVEDLAPMLRRLLGDRISLETQDLAGGAVVNADPSQLDQVIVNLVVNARHAMPTGGTLTIQTSCHSAHADDPALPAEAAPGDHVVIEVRDTGVGMDAATLERIFEPFFSTRGPGQGSGLGLATVDGIVRQSGGFITVESSPGQGATFRVHLPAVEAPADAIPSLHDGGAAGAAPGGTETVLVVEDDRAVRSFAVRTLSDAGYAVLEAASGEDALELCAGHGSIDLVLTDLRMPGIQGRDLATRLEAERPGLRILLMTGFDDEAAADTAATCGRPLIHKPFGADALAIAVRDALDGPA